MKQHQVWLLLATVAGISTGQILFKIGAGSLARTGGLPGLLVNRFFVAGIALYGACALAWVYILRDLELNKAYPFFAFSFVVVPLLGWVFLGEPFGRLYVLGVVCICVGVILVTR